MKTSELEQRLESAEEFDEELINDNSCPELCAMITGYMDEKGITRTKLIRRLNLDGNYGYQLLSGTRNPRRDYLIQMGLLPGLDIEEFQRLLKTAKKKPQYVRDAFDAMVFFAVKHKMSYEKAVEFI